MTKFEEIVWGFISTSEAKHFKVFLGRGEEKCLLIADTLLEAGENSYRNMRNPQKTGGNIRIVREETKGENTVRETVARSNVVCRY